MFDLTPQEVLHMIRYLGVDQTVQTAYRKPQYQAGKAWYVYEEERPLE